MKLIYNYTENYNGDNVVMLKEFAIVKPPQYMVPVNAFTKKGSIACEAIRALALQGRLYEGDNGKTCFSGEIPQDAFLLLARINDPDIRLEVDCGNATWEFYKWIPSTWIRKPEKDKEGEYFLIKDEIFNLTYCNSVTTINV